MLLKAKKQLGRAVSPSIQWLSQLNVSSLRGYLEFMTGINDRILILYFGDLLYLSCFQDMRCSYPSCLGSSHVTAADDGISVILSNQTYQSALTKIGLSDALENLSKISCKRPVDSDH